MRVSCKSANICVYPKIFSTRHQSIAENLNTINTFASILGKSPCRSTCLYFPPPPYYTVLDKIINIRILFLCGSLSIEKTVSVRYTCGVNFRRHFKSSSYNIPSISSLTLHIFISSLLFNNIIFIRITPSHFCCQNI